MLFQATSIAIAGRAVLINGAPGLGKSTLALELIDRGAGLIGDDGTLLSVSAGQLLASAPPLIRGLLEIRNLGLIALDVADAVPVALMITLDPAAPRFIETAASHPLLGIEVPQIALWPDCRALALKVEIALKTYGLC